MQGLVLLDKPEGISSFGAVAAVRKIFNQKRIGHTGTLDPFATGVLPILLGRATRLSSYILESDKSYLAEIKLGITTDTLDITGTVLSEKTVNINIEQIEDVLKNFRGKILQQPPMFSAIHQDGVRLYQLARQGKTVERPKREVEIFSNQIVDFNKDTLLLSVDCSKGTYIRSLADDIGKALGCGATVSKLRRTRSSNFSIEQCVTLEQLKEQPEKYILSAENAVSHLDSVNVTDNQAKRILNGGAIFLSRCGAQNIDEKLYKIMYNKQFIALGQVNSKQDLLNIKCIIKEEND